MKNPRPEFNENDPPKTNLLLAAEAPCYRGQLYDVRRFARLVAEPPKQKKPSWWKRWGKFLPLPFWRRRGSYVFDLSGNETLGKMSKPESVDP